MNSSIDGWTEQTQEQEESDFNEGCATEQQNCLTEAEQEVYRLSDEAPEFGQGDFTVTVRYPYYCKATDAFAGMVVSKRVHFPTRQGALDYVHAEQNEDGEESYEITPHEEVAHSSIVDDDIPF